MPSVCFYFQVHQPFRLRRYSYFEASRAHDYFDEKKNREIMEKVASKCYLPANRTILNLIKRFGDAFRVSYSITGVAIEQMRKYSPAVLESFLELRETEQVEFLGETYYHSLAAIYDKAEFTEQVRLHERLMKSTFGIEPKVFRNTELIYDDNIGRMAGELGYNAVLAEGWDEILGWRSPNFVYTVPGSDNTKLLLKNYRLSDDVAFRFSNRSWAEFPLTAEKYASWIHAISGGGEVANLFMDYETFGEHQWESTGIFSFLEHFPEILLRKSDWNFRTPSEVLGSYNSVADLSFHRLTSWADLERDLTAWRGNRMQRSVLDQIFSLGQEIRRKGDPLVLDIWRKLLTSDHFYYMCTKWFSDGDVHAYFSPYDSPYEAFINYMNVLKDFKDYYLGASAPVAVFA